MASCPYCKSPILHKQLAVQCTACGSLHHGECWTKHGKCSIYGCDSETADQVAGPRWRLRLILAAIIVSCVPAILHRSAGFLVTLIPLSLWYLYYVAGTNKRMRGLNEVLLPVYEPSDRVKSTAYVMFVIWIGVTIYYYYVALHALAVPR